MLASPEEHSTPVEALDKEALVQRNPHRNFAAVEASRPDYDPSTVWTASKTPCPGWQAGSGANSHDWASHATITIDPYEDGRLPVQNYKLMISSTVPRPIALVSTVSAAGVSNIAPFSYFQNVSNDPPLYSLSLVGEHPNDTLRNILDTKELCISIISDWAANMSSVNTPPHVSEWPLSGLTPSPSGLVQPPHVAESAFSIECRYHSHTDILGRAAAGVRTATLVLVEAVRFHVRQDSIADDRATVDLAKLRPVFRAGGITYGSCFQGFELPRPDSFGKMLQTDEVKRVLR